MQSLKRILQALIAIVCLLLIVFLYLLRQPVDWTLYLLLVLILIGCLDELDIF